MAGDPADNLDTLEALFAGLSVLIGILALAIGAIQLLRHRRRHASLAVIVIFELEAGQSQVSIDQNRDIIESNIDVGLDL